MCVESFNIDLFYDGEIMVYMPWQFIEWTRNNWGVRNGDVLASSLHKWRKNIGNNERKKNTRAKLNWMNNLEMEGVFLLSVRH